MTLFRILAATSRLGVAQTAVARPSSSDEYLQQRSLRLRLSQLFIGNIALGTLRYCLRLGLSFRLWPFVLRCTHVLGVLGWPCGSSVEQGVGR